MDFALLQTFVKVAELGSFTRAAEQLGLPKSRVSTSVQQLEAQLGTRLLHRTTRTVRVTPDGEQFLERGKALLADAEELQALFQQTPSSLRGRLRVDLPTGLARSVVIPRLPEFLAAHPLVEIELSTTDRRVDLVHEGFDCVLRVGQLQDSGLVARRLGHLSQVNCASPAYLAQYGTPRTLEDLARHRLVRWASSPGGAVSGWEYHDGERYRVLEMQGVITVNHTDAYQTACLAGLGLIQAPRFGAMSSLDAGLLVEVMPGFTGEPMPVSLLYANRRNLPKRVQALMDWLAEVLAPHLDPVSG
ncbi:LysR family transcriptional regulator [Variovorax fucosicus]|uniref:LysR family transcriptional regulator n=1 Tax=Variovorax fucosicus TaxID=3053517 RepID=UPI002576A7C9|nr:LysR family transcriptional regulator [Variovorax sp. J22G47]MDM0056003.1 LysR family transcriptional regulator [Variovorax sp. J22G47]